MPFDLTQLNYDFTRFDLPTLYTAVATYRHRPVIPHPLPNNPTDPTLHNWLADTDGDHVFYNAHTSPLLQTHSQLDILAHILLGHHPLTFTPHQTAQALTLALRLGLQAHTWPPLNPSQLSALNWLRHRLERFFPSDAPPPLYSQALPHEQALPAYAQLIAILTAKFRYQTAVHTLTTPTSHPATPHFRSLNTIDDTASPPNLLTLYAYTAQRLHETNQHILA